MVDTPLIVSKREYDFFKWVRKTHPSTYNRLKKAHEGAMKND